MPAISLWKKQKLLLKLSVAFLVFFFLTSCGRPMSWGLVLWDSDEHIISAGAVVPIYIRSNINQVWVIGSPLGEERNGEKYEVPIWQVKEFSSRSRALEEAEHFAPNARLYAQTLSDGLPIRAKPENVADLVYRLREGEIIKIMAETKGAPVTSGAGNLEGAWYRVMTEGGIFGYTFSNRLKLFEKEQTQALQETKVADMDEALKEEFDELVSRLWYPRVYADMLKAGQIDLAAFSRQEGLSFDINAKKLYWVDSNGRHAEDWGDVSTNTVGNWRFAEGKVLVQLISDGSIQFSWPELFSEPKSLILLERPVGEIIAGERERRQLAQEAFWRRGPELQSLRYGKLSLLSGNAFHWTDYTFLVPEIIPNGLSGRGTVDFSLFLDKNIRLSVTGAVRFNFNLDDAEGTTFPVNFFYNLESGGLRLQYIPPEAIDGNVVFRRDNRAPSILFTRREGS